MIRLLLALALSAQICFAAEISVQPSAASMDRLQQVISGNAAHASTDVEGAGNTLRIRYSSENPIDVYILFLREGDTLNPRDTLFAELPPDDEGEALIPLSHTRGWRAGTQKLRMHFLTKKEEEQAIHSVQLTDATVRAGGVRQYLAPEPFAPSSYHRLEGYRIFGHSSAALLTGILFLLLAGTLILRKNRIALVIALAGVLLSNGRFTADLLRMTYANTKEWTQAHTYAAAGSVYEIASFLRENDIQTVRLCTDGNSYFPVLLQYAIFPSVIAQDAKHVLVRNAYDWSYDNSFLRCRNIEHAATRVKTFADGSELFSLQP
ncbi:hypothetical protein A2454_06480 [Candidatus Peribacteria bacterium RIFOXYC2_FULL_55_14]|nr:MAG: hypothetical protein UY85_C0022G0007 [Candidatus Peribacteria bacterium GW2011_GWB1_54_5]OGJ70753.1 MAG: hypothetical protein A2198_02480 [Candidatus Peribacteria bacterium RIFOXYA1_FULL_56_14]OGJ74171.1 MAG: hypothetical protein A2217_00850 [Candidatus Peribacteria bacterium RIFOXYA2_FULL_55_28]OGJ75602.1 MAG: hypothetical protein A2384_01810 [Candidatus Peribacteria bacterium RIFOXYB1_FULL_54_35]OGJ76222.1 MAG: hypothetical protein A2327_00060 [Candidatus Peribacteria bacterium RIFOXY